MPQFTAYGLLFSVAIHHPFFRNGIPRELALTPSDETKDRLKNLGLLYRSYPGGIKVILPIDRLPQLQNLELFEEHLCFYLINRIPQFINFTELPIGFDQYKRKEILLFDNLDRPGTLLHASDTVGEAEIIQYDSPLVELTLVEEASALDPFRNQIQLVAAQGTDLEIEYMDTLRGRVVGREKIGAEEREYMVNGETVQKVSIRRGQRQFWLDLSDLPESQFSIIINREERKRFGLLKQTAAMPPLGLVNISLSEVLRQWDGEARKGPAYQIRFSNRATIWKYYFIRETEDLEIKSVSVTEKKRNVGPDLPAVGNGANGQSSIFHSSIDLESFINGRGAKVVVSKETIGLLEHQERAFQSIIKAEKKIENKVIQLTMDLPVATADRIKMDQGEICSEIYIYV